jgi:vitamin B12 transporter
VEGVTVTVARDTVRRGAAAPDRCDHPHRHRPHRGRRRLAQLLKKQVAVDVIEYPGLLAGIGMRGFRPQFSGINQRTLVLLDGRPAGDQQPGAARLRGVQRVEVLRGPASALYGSNAMGGVVNLITRRSEGPIVRSSATLGYGSWDTREGWLSAGGSVTSALRLRRHARGARARQRLPRRRGQLLPRPGGRLGGAARLRGFDLALARGRCGEVRPFTRYGTRSGSARLGYRFSDAWRVDYRAEALRADRVENPGDLFSTWGDGRSLKNVARASSDLSLGGLGRAPCADAARVFSAVEDRARTSTGPRRPRRAAVRQPEQPGTAGTGCSCRTPSASARTR